MTKRLIKEHLINNVWTVGTIVGFSLIFLLLRAVLGDRFILDLVIADRDIIKVAESSAFLTFIGICAVVLVTLLFVSYVTGIVYAATTRTYLGAGVARRSYLKSLLAAWGTSAVSVALGSVLVAVIAGIWKSDFSGTLTVADYTVQGLLWYVPIAGLAAVFLANAVGFLTGLVFVRFPWWIGVGAILLYVLIDSWTNGWISSWGGFLDWHVGTGGSQLWKHVLAGGVQSVVVIGISWALLRRLSIRR
ncbi:hypothetical protein [Ancrocorticia populi]|uniref:hypothetical protein n=1 Tax=Ancrocorticia populi TaxID=2175228 RepID=UPI003F956E5E